MSASLSLTSLLGGCPAGGAAEACGARTIAGPFRGLGQVNGAYAFPVDLGPPACPPGDDFGRGLAYRMRLTVVGKGSIELAVADGACIVPAYNSSQTFRVTGGTGTYAGASGSGTLERQLGETTNTGRHGRENWTGILSVPGLEFDVSPPTIASVASKVVRAPKAAKRVRVRYSVTARDDTDGAIPARCLPASGSWFRFGRTSVACSATDSSANTAVANFTVTVRRRN